MTTHFLTSGSDCQIQDNCIIGLKYREDCQPAVLGNGARIRAGSIVYADVSAGIDFQTGHHVMIREKTSIGDHVVVGTNTVIDGHATIGSFVKIESNCYIPTHATLGNRVFLGPNVTLTNDRYPLKMRDHYKP